MFVYWDKLKEGHPGDGDYIPSDCPLPHLKEDKETPHYYEVPWDDIGYTLLGWLILFVIFGAMGLFIFHD